VDDIDRCPDVLLLHRDGRQGFPSRRLLQIELLQVELLCPRPHLLRSGPDLRRSGSDVLCAGSDLLRSGSGLLRSQELRLRFQLWWLPVEVWLLRWLPFEVRQWLRRLRTGRLLQEVLQAQVLRSGPELLCSGSDLRRSDLRRSLCSPDVRCSRGLLQLVDKCV